MFIHGLWLLPSSWDRWAALFADADYAPVSPGWPDDPDTVVEANAGPDVFADKTVGQVADHYSQVIGTLTRPPAVIGHSFGGLFAQILAGSGQSAVTVAIDAAPFRGVLPLPLSLLKAAFPVLGNPANRHRAVPLTYEQFRFAFASAEDFAMADTHIVESTPTRSALATRTRDQAHRNDHNRRHRQLPAQLDALRQGGHVRDELRRPGAAAAPVPAARTDGPTAPVSFHTGFRTPPRDPSRPVDSNRA